MHIHPHTPCRKVMHIHPLPPHTTPSTRVRTMVRRIEQLSDQAPGDRDRKTGGILGRAEGNTENENLSTVFNDVQQLGTKLDLHLGLTNRIFNLCDSGRLSVQNRDQLERPLRTGPRPGKDMPGMEPGDWVPHSEVGAASQSQQPGHKPGTSSGQGTASQQPLASQSQQTLRIEKDL